MAGHPILVKQTGVVNTCILLDYSQRAAERENDIPDVVEKVDPSGPISGDMFYEPEEQLESVRSDPYSSVTSNGFISARSFRWRVKGLLLLVGNCSGLDEYAR